MIFLSFVGIAALWINNALCTNIEDMPVKITDILVKYVIYDRPYELLLVNKKWNERARKFLRELDYYDDDDWRLACSFNMGLEEDNHDESSGYMIRIPMHIVAKLPESAQTHVLSAYKNRNTKDNQIFKCLGVFLLSSLIHTFAFLPVHHDVCCEGLNLKELGQLTAEYAIAGMGSFFIIAGTNQEFPENYPSNSCVHQLEMTIDCINKVLPFYRFDVDYVLGVLAACSMVAFGGDICVEKNKCIVMVEMVLLTSLMGILRLRLREWGRQLMIAYADAMIAWLLSVMLFSI